MTPTTAEASRAPSAAAFRRLWAAAGLSNLGDGMVIVSAPLLAATLTRDPVLIGGLTAMVYLPYLLLGVPAGVLVDRVERRRAMVLANLARIVALVVLCAGLLAGAVTIGWLYALAFVLGAAECVYDAAAEGAVPRLVASEKLDGANARLQGTVQVANSFVGAPVGALLFAVVAVAPFGAQAVLLALATMLVATLPRLSAARERVAGAAIGLAGVWHDTREGVRWLARHRQLRTLALVSAGFAFGNQLAQATLVLFALEVLHLPEAAFGLFAMAAAAGAVGGAAAAPALARRFGRLTVMIGAGVVETVCLALMGVTSDVVAAGAVFAVFAGSVGAWNVLSMSLRQQLVPSELFGRVHGAWRTLVWGALPLGSWLGGLIAAQGGLRAPWFVGAGLFVVVVVVAVPALRSAGSGSTERSAQGAADQH